MKRDERFPKGFSPAARQAILRVLEKPVGVTPVSVRLGQHRTRIPVKEVAATKQRTADEILMKEELREVLDKWMETGIVSQRRRQALEAFLGWKGIPEFNLAKISEVMRVSSARPRQLVDGALGNARSDRALMKRLEFFLEN